MVVRISGNSMFTAVYFSMHFLHSKTSCSKGLFVQHCLCQTFDTHSVMSVALFSTKRTHFCCFLCFSLLWYCCFLFPFPWSLQVAGDMLFDDNFDIGQVLEYFKLKVSSLSYFSIVWLFVSWNAKELISSSYHNHLTV